MNKTRQFLPTEFTISSWDDLKPYYETLLNQNINSIEDLKAWLKKRSELDSIVSEDLAWRYIKMTCNTANEEIEQAYLDFVTNIQPNIAPYEDKFNKKLIESPFTSQLENQEGYRIYFRNIRKEIELFREENIPLFTEISTLSQQYGAINGAMTVEINGTVYTLQQASNFLKSTDRVVRKEAYEKIATRRLEDKDTLDDLLSQLVYKRNQVAVNAGFANFRDYMHSALGRFDYTVQDCFSFHDAIADKVMPLVRELHMERRGKLGYDELKPYDTEVDISGKPPLKPFEGGLQLIEKSIHCFEKLDPYFASCLDTMQSMSHFDLDSRLNKAPGGYNYPLAETGVPFIFMNAAGNLRDVETMVHEGGHAVHAFLAQPLELNAFKECPSEVAELASMSMELLTMDEWTSFFESEEELIRAQLEQLEGVIKTLPWIATVDKFQHWLYENPTHTPQQRAETWLNIIRRFSTDVIDWIGYEEALAYSWQKQLHIFEVPFYYIEYGIAQLGAIAVWRNYKLNGKKALEQYKNALKLGYTRSIPEIYQEAGIRFDFSSEYVNELFRFVSEEHARLKSRLS